MKTILIGTTEITIISCEPYTYSGGRGEKVLRFKVSAENATFDLLKETLEGNEQPIQYKEDGNLVCEYVGYGSFEVQYSNGVYEIEMHKAGIDEQMNALLIANEKLNTANSALQATAETLTEQNAILAEQNIMLNSTLSEVLETIIPSTIGEIMEMVEKLEGRVTELENKETVNEETVTDETVSE